MFGFNKHLSDCNEGALARHHLAAVAVCGSESGCRNDGRRVSRSSIAGSRLLQVQAAEVARYHWTLDTVATAPDTMPP